MNKGELCEIKIGSSWRVDRFDTTTRLCGGIEYKGESFIGSDVRKVPELLADKQRIEALEAALKEAHRVILHELDNGRTPYMLPVDNGGKGLGYIEDVLAGINRHV